MIRTLACVIVVILCLGACSGSHEHKDYTGTLYFVTGQVLYAMNLQNKQVKPVYENRNMIMDSVEKLDDQHLILGYKREEKGRTAFGEQVVNRLNGIVSAYGNGMQMENLRYLPELHVAVFSGVTKEADHWSLYWANVVGPFEPQLIDDSATVGSIIVISNHQIIYTLGALGGAFQIKMYDFETHQSSLLKLVGCDPILWRSRTDQLVCRSNNGAGPYYLTHLDGSDRQPISFGWMSNGPFMVAYIKKYDAAVMTSYGEVRFSFTRGFYENSDLYLYEFQMKKLINIVNRYASNASLGAAVWYPNNVE